MLSIAMGTLEELWRNDSGGSRFKQPGLRNVFEHLDFDIGEEGQLLQMIAAVVTNCEACRRGTHRSSFLFSRLLNRAQACVFPCHIGWHAMSWAVVD